MYRREWLAATAVCCAASIAGCGDSVTGEQPQEVQTTDERSSIDDSQRAAILEEIQAVEESTTEELASVEASAESEITDIRDDTKRQIQLLEQRGENWLERSDSRDSAVLVDTIEDSVDGIRQQAEKGRERIRAVVERERATIEQTESEGQTEIEGIPGSILDGEPDDELESSVQTAVDSLESSAQNTGEAIETTAQQARAAITEQAQTSIANLETELEQHR